ncbi:MAG: NADH-quinone oxidoreductase subunit H [Lachnospiraceae bacterium]|nr:NADH-quinone oxidoreductase subunit H [Lachnospiraceae bacterium]
MSLGIAILVVIAYILLTPAVGLAMEGYDRVLTARMQGRKGPPLLQPLYDIQKLFNKQAIVVNNLQTVLVLGFVIFTIFTGCIFFAGGDILLVFFAHSLSDMFLVLAACSANSPYSSLGAQREFIQMMAYEPMTLLAAIGFYMVCGSFNVSDIIAADVPAVMKAPGVFLGYAFILVIKFRKSPFDLATSHHAHQEMVKGLTQDISGRSLGWVEVGDLYEQVQMLAIAGLFFVWRNPWSYLLAFGVCMAIYFTMILVDNVYPRVKWQPMLAYTWAITFILGGGNFLILTMLKR